MKKLNICIDIDGTITDPYYWIQKAGEYFGKQVNIDEFTEYEFYKILDIPAEDYCEFYEKNKFELHAKDKLQDNAMEVINMFFSNNNIYFVTARDKSLELLTYSYLKSNDIHFDGLFVLGSHYKVNQAKILNCDIFIEDCLNNALTLSKAGFKVLLMNTTYNQYDLSSTNITRVYNWLDILLYINSILYSNKVV